MLARLRLGHLQVALIRLSIESGDWRTRFGVLRHVDSFAGNGSSRWLIGETPIPLLGPGDESVGDDDR